jgi:hypothetical protein
MPNLSLFSGIALCLAYNERHGLAVSTSVQKACFQNCRKRPSCFDSGQFLFIFYFIELPIQEAWGFFRYLQKDVPVKSIFMDRQPSHEIRCTDN